jgi:hypothetical protein
MKRSRLTAAIATSVTMVAVGAGTAAATGVLSSGDGGGSASTNDHTDLFDVPRG